MCAITDRNTQFDLDMLIDAVVYAPDLKSLCAALNRAEASTLRGDQRVEDILPLSSLPTFGPEPADTAGVYSWDETHFLVFEGSWMLAMRGDIELPQYLRHEIFAKNITGHGQGYPGYDRILSVMKKLTTDEIEDLASVCRRTAEKRGEDAFETLGEWTFDDDY